MRSVTKITKEKTAKIIPNAVGVCTEEDKHIFASLLSRDTTFKLMTRLWKRAIRELATDGRILEEDLMLPDAVIFKTTNFDHGFRKIWVCFSVMRRKVVSLRT